MPTPYSQFSIQNQPTAPLPGQVTNAGDAKFVDVPNPARVKQTIAITITAPVLGTTYSLTVEGEVASFVSTGVAADDADLLRDAIEDNIILNGMFDVVDVGAVVTLTTREPGRDFDYLLSAPAVLVAVNTPSSLGTAFEAGRPLFWNSGAPSQTAPAGTTTSNIADRLLGITPRNYNSAARSPSDDAYMQPAGGRVEIMANGCIGVRDGASAAFRDPLYIGVANADVGKFFTTAGADRALLPASFGYWVGPYEVCLRFGR